MTLPVRRHRTGGLAERQFPGWRDPLAEFDDLFNRIGTLLESTVSPLAPSAQGMMWSPMADLSETDEAYVLEIDLPGVRREDIDVEIGDREMIITGELRERERVGVMRRRTRRTGHFEYRAMLSSEVNADGVSATLTDGVLTVTIPKAEAAKPRHIEIAVGT
jgi:HSP20 family protein